MCAQAKHADNIFSRPYGEGLAIHAHIVLQFIVDEIIQLLDSTMEPREGRCVFDLLENKGL